MSISKDALIQALGTGSGEDIMSKLFAKGNARVINEFMENNIKPDVAIVSSAKRTFCERKIKVINSILFINLFNLSLSYSINVNQFFFINWIF